MIRIVISFLVALIVASPCAAETLRGRAEYQLSKSDLTAVNSEISLVRAHALQTEDTKASKLLYDVAVRILGDAPVVVEHSRTDEREKKGTNVLIQVMELSF